MQWEEALMSEFYSKEKSVAVLKICDTQGSNIANFYSSLKDDKKGIPDTVNALRRRILKGWTARNNIEYGAASIYYNKTATGRDDLIARYNGKGELTEKNY